MYWPIQGCAAIGASFDLNLVSTITPHWGQVYLKLSPQARQDGSAIIFCERHLGHGNVCCMLLALPLEESCHVSVIVIHQIKKS